MGRWLLACIWCPDAPLATLPLHTPLSPIDAAGAAPTCVARFALWDPNELRLPTPTALVHAFLWSLLLDFLDLPYVDLLAPYVQARAERSL